MNYDLHSHSIASDGTLTPTALIDHAVTAGVTHLALTDHDTIAGLDEAQNAAAKQPIALIAGAELSAMWNGRTVHIVGLHLDTHSNVLQSGIRQQLEFRDWRGREIARRLEKKAAVPDAYEGALSHVHGNLVRIIDREQSFEKQKIDMRTSRGRRIKDSMIFDNVINK